MAIVVKGADVAARIRDDIRERIKKLSEAGKNPKLVMISVGDDPANASYERGILKVFGDLGIQTEKKVLDEKISQEEFDSAFTKVNEDASVSGILVFRPLPKPLSIEFAAKTINPLRMGVSGMLHS